jgi:hypothetical protein
MATSQSVLTAILRAQIQGLEERCPGYRAKAADTLGKIILMEHQNKIKPGQIRQDVKRECLALGSFLANSLKAEAPPGDKAREGAQP